MSFAIPIVITAAAVAALMMPCLLLVHRGGRMPADHENL
jgi:hypothetical protein